MKIVILCIGLIVLSCAASEPFIDTSEVLKDESPSKELQTNQPSNDIELEALRSLLSDVYTTKTNEIPEEYARIKTQDNSEEDKDLFAGYRVQIYSGKNVDLADTIASIFRTWSDTTIVGYQAETYTFFKAPYYKVHVGDFQDRNRAIYFSNLLKRRFRDSWVVYDRINPWNAPSDTTDF